ncbi:MAG: DMT family transporter [Verrucomicrobia bacterium]|nr:DMT family transporter [Verrucomicrobiota bacterium]
MKDIRKGVLYMLLSAAGLSFFGLFVKLGTASVSFFLLTFLRFFVPFLLILPYVLWKVGIPKFSQLGNLRLQLGRVGCILVYQYAIFYYLTKTTLLDATVLQNTAPFFIPLIEKIFMEHRIKKELILGMLISFIGVLFILRPDRGIFGSLSIIGLIAALGQAGSQVFFGMQSRAERQETNLFYLFFFSSIVSFLLFFVFALLNRGIALEIDSLMHVDQKFYWYLFALGLATISNQSFRGVAYRYARPGILAPLLYFSVIVSGLLDWVVFDNLPDRWITIGAILVVVGGIIPYIQRKVKEQK